MGRSFGIYQVIRIARHISIIQSIKHLILLLDARLIRMIGYRLDSVTPWFMCQIDFDRIESSTGITGA